MRRTFEELPKTCRLCPRAVLETRRGLCRGCYLREYRGTALPEGARCACGVSNPIALLKCGGGARCYNCRALDRSVA